MEIYIERIFLRSSKHTVHNRCQESNKAQFVGVNGGSYGLRNTLNLINCKIVIERDSDMKYVEVENHKMHVFAAGDTSKPRLVLMSGSATVAPVYDFKILYEKLISNYRIIVIEKFGYGYSDQYEGPCDIDTVIAFQREALEKAGEKEPYILMPHSMSGLEAIRWKQEISV